MTTPASSRINTVALAFLIVFVPYSIWVKEGIYLKLQSSSQSLAGTRVDDFELPDSEGQKKLFSEIVKDKKVVVLHFWATWCPSCMLEMPDLIDLQNEYADQGMTIVGVSIDQDEQALRSFLAKNGVSFPVLVDSEGTLMEKFNLSGVPTSLVLDQHGKVLQVFVGGSDNLEMMVKLWLKQS